MRWEKPVTLLKATDKYLPLPTNKILRNLAKQTPINFIIK